MLFRRGGARIQWELTERREGKYLWWEGEKRRRILYRTLDTPLEAVTGCLVSFWHVPQNCLCRTALTRLCKRSAVRFTANSTILNRLLDAHF